MASAGRARGGELTAEDRALLEQLRGEIPRVRKSPLYVLGLLIVAVAMVLLPLIYLGLIAGIAWLVYLHAVYDVGLVSGGTGARSRLLVYVAPLIIGPVAILFMLKPLFARPARRETGVTPPQTDEPLLYEFVDRLCEVVHAPRPRTIMLDANVNAAAGFRRGWLDWLTGGLTLRIGMPLVAGMTLQQLAGVLAHELGHFAQGFGMRLSYVVESINRWFARVVYERDAWDAALEAAGEKSGSGYWKVLVAATRFVVWLTRRVLWVLMVAGRAISCFMARQMEYDADLYEARVAGSRAFAGTFRRLHVLGFSHEAAHHELEAGWRERRLADDLSALTRSLAGRISKEGEEKLAARMVSAKARWFDTHPSASDRIRAVERVAAPGILHDERPAAALFRDFRRWSRAATLEYYQQGLGLDVDHGNLVSTAGMVAERERAAEAMRNLEAYLGFPVYLRRPPVRISDGIFTRQATGKELAALLGEAQRGIAATRDAARRAHAAFRKATERLDELDIAARVQRLGVKLKAGDFNLPAVDAAAIETERSAATRELTAALDVLQPYHGLIEQRLASALRLLGVHGIERYVPVAEALQTEARRLTESLAKVLAIVDARNLRGPETNALYAALTALQDDSENAAVHASLNAAVAAFTTFIREQRRSVYNVPYPFAHASGEVSIGNYLFPDGDVTEPGVVVNSLRCATSNLEALYDRLVARLVEIAMEVETGLKQAKAARSA